MSNCDNIVTIDGPSGSGKSTISRLLAKKLQFAFLDTGAMYRAVGLKIKEVGVDLADQVALQKILHALDLTLEPGDADTKVLLDGTDVSLAIRTAEMGMVASKVSALGAVRQKLTDLQQKIGSKGAVVAEGRDMGTVVFPCARYKFFLSASPEERARRRTLQLEEQGMPSEYEQILGQIKQRDHDDRTRELAPLKPADDANIVDSSEMTIAQVVDYMFTIVQDKA